MTSWFAGLNQAASGLNAARYGLSVVSQNMANAGTPGYTRQVADQESVDMSSVSGIFTGHGSMGGTTVAATSRQTDPVLDARVRSEDARGALADTAATQLGFVQSVFQEPSDGALAGQLTDFWAAWGTLANDPGSIPTRSVVLQDAAKLAGTLNTMSSSLSDVVAGVSQNLTDDVAAVNSAAGRLATLNGQIAVGTATGGNVNSLLDQRDQLLDTLSKLTGASATIGANGAADVSLGGQSLVSGVTATTMSVDAGYAVSVGGTAVPVGSGSIGAETIALTTTLPGYQGQLDAVANGIVSTVNGIQSGGYDLDGANPAADLFTGSGAAGITVAFTDPRKIAASSTPGGNLDGGNALKAAQAGAAPGSPDATYAALVGDVGAATALAQQQASTQDSVVANVAALKSSVSGVSLDEEAANMLMYQQAFNAASRVLTTMDSMLDTLINHTGLVGLQ